MVCKGIKKAIALQGTSAAGSDELTVVCELDIVLNVWA
jgi:hypothetical protein